MKETTVVKRPALYKGEIGLFPPSQMAAEDLAVAPMNSEVMIGFRSERNIQQLNFLWAIPWELAHAGRYLDKYEGMKDLCIRAAHSKLMWDTNTKQFELRRKSLRNLSYETMTSLIAKVVSVVLTDILPGMPRNQFIARIEEMIGEPHD